MRWVFSFLLIINIVLLLWRFAMGVPNKYQPPKQEPPYVVPQGVARVLLLSEPVNSRSAEPGASVPSLETQNMCRLVGAFDKEERAQVFLERLAALDVSADLQKLEVSQKKTYWLYLQGSGDPKQARVVLADLQKRGIDSYILPKGDMNHGISLGLFSDEVAATARVGALTKKGLSPRLKTVERPIEELWVVVKQTEVQKISKKLWQKLIKTQFKLQEKQKSCLDVASK